ncbi:MAG: hypothetical protein AABX05_02380, partial [Nanoarchaeota archaeon]
MSGTLSKRLIENLAKAGISERVDKEKLAISAADHLIDLLANQRYQRVQGLGDDFIPNTELYNALGAVYPSLPRDI